MRVFLCSELAPPSSNGFLSWGNVDKRRVIANAYLPTLRADNIGDSAVYAIPSFS